MFVTETLKVFGPKVKADAAPVAGAYVAARPLFSAMVTFAVATPWPENQAMPSRTRSRRNTYVPGSEGGAMVARTDALVPIATSAGSALRCPSHRTVFPATSLQW